MESYIVQVDSNQVWMNQEKRGKKHRVQYESKILFSAIKDIKMIKTNLNSRGKRIDGAPQCFAMKKYLVFVKEDKKEVWMNVSHYTNGYILKIIKEIIERIVTGGNNYEGSDAFSIMDKYKKEEMNKGFKSLK